MKRCRHDKNWILSRELVYLMQWVKAEGKDLRPWATDVPEETEVVRFVCDDCGYTWRGDVWSRLCPKWLRERYESMRSRKFEERGL